MKKLLCSLALLTYAMVTNAQTLDELKAEQKAKKDSISDIQKRVDALQSQIDAFPGWKIGAFGVVGGSLSSFENWYSQGTPNNSSGNFGGTVNAYANLDREKYFWKNALNLNLKWVKLDDKDDPTDDDSFQPTTDVFNVTSLYGYKIAKNLAASALMEYRTTILDNFNDPGYLDLGVGATWTPITDLIVVVHPLNYNIVFSKEDTVFESSFGSKIVADYTRKLGPVDFKTNFSAFLSYKSSDLSNWTWTNSFTYTLWKNIGIGFDFGLRGNKQEALNYALQQYDPLVDTEPTFDNVDNKLQSYYTLGLSYKF
ncbi:DUF3078 domain-containing protein [Mangrovimonas sp. DI 80]|uniref:DUF3078 domain-containing protein n=1 Tax=Mangrovimonas sp. DI 80 TaxID=1779330 RepID=UPI0009781924|nr:DUF3078 domain-containing protein [Mangrovimonas sp. DI 80]OMP32089.1 hypothetical protein BKM32_03275 [Mangrovimonas sp. DI 80]